MKIVWTKESLNRLIEIETFIAEDNPEKASEFIAFLMGKTELISDNPKIGRMVPEFSNPTIRELIVKNYRIVYRIRISTIEILTVFEGHRLIRRDEIFKDE
jgi:addiction module RelE/StbE family toxin